MAWTTTRHEPHRRDGQAARPHCGTAARTPHVRHGTVAGPPPGELHEDSKTDRGDKTPGSKCRHQDGAAGLGSAHRRGHRTGRPRRVARIPALARGRPPQPPPVRRAAADRAGKLFLQATSEEDTKPPGDPERPGQLARKRAGGLHRPPQRRHRITPHIRLNQRQQCRPQPRIQIRDPPTAPARTPRPPQRLLTGLEFEHALADRRLADRSGLCHGSDTAVPPGPGPPQPSTAVAAARPDAGATPRTSRRVGDEFHPGWAYHTKERQNGKHHLDPLQALR